MFFANRRMIRLRHTGLPFDETNIQFPFPREEYYRPVTDAFCSYGDLKWGLFFVKRANPIYRFDVLRVNVFGGDDLENDVTRKIYQELIPFHVSRINPLYKYKKKKIENPW